MPSETKKQRPIWQDDPRGPVKVIDQRRLPHERVESELRTVDDAIYAIQTLMVRGAPLIGVTAAYGVVLAAAAAVENGGDQDYIEAEAARLKAARPTAVNLAWAVDRALGDVLSEVDPVRRVARARQTASALAEEEAANCRSIGLNGLPIIEALSRSKQGQTVNVLTHCNAGWLACVEYGTATAPIYAAFDRGIDLHVWVDETRPLNQGARLTAWELGEYGVPHTVITDNAGGHLMQHGRWWTSSSSAATAPRPTGMWPTRSAPISRPWPQRTTAYRFMSRCPRAPSTGTCATVAEIPIEERDPDEVRWVQGWDGERPARVRICPEKSPAANFAFDVTPGHLVTGLITERGVCRATAADIRRLFPDKMK